MFDFDAARPRSNRYADTKAGLARVQSQNDLDDPLTPSMSNSIHCTLFDGLVPLGTMVVEANPPMWEDGLWADELPLVARFAPKRRREFTAGRNCARRALQLMNRPEVSIPVGTGREPLLPSGVVGSITHTDTYCAAALLDAGVGLSIGIDAEQAGAIMDEVTGLVMRPSESAHVDSLAILHPGQPWAALMFSAKEAFQKALYRRWPVRLDFLDVELSIAADIGCFEVRVDDREMAARLGGSSFTGRFRFTHGLVLTAITIPL